MPLSKVRNEDRAILTTPEGLLVAPSTIPNAGLGVIAEKFFPKNSRFGPYEGYLGTEEGLAQTGYSWQVEEASFFFIYGITPYNLFIVN